MALLIASYTVGLVIAYWVINFWIGLSQGKNKEFDSYYFFTLILYPVSFPIFILLMVIFGAVLVITKAGIWFKNLGDKF